MKKRVILTALVILVIVSLFWGSSRYPALNEKVAMAVPYR